MEWEFSDIDENWLSIKEKELNLNKRTLRLLYNRDITENKSIIDFIKSGYEGLRDPFDFERMPDAINKIIEIKNKNGKIFIYGDYDVDGITSAAFLTIVFRNIGLNVDYFIPSRMDNGYGLNVDAIKKMADNGANLIITVDTGINSHEEVIYAKERSIDLIITDHHKLVAEEGKNVLTINPKLSNNYQFKLLAGAGVALKLAQALYQKLDISVEKLYEYLDIVMIGTVADVVPMIDENRIIIKNGLKVLEKTKIKGLIYLLKYLKFSNKNLTTTDISYYISPLLNALGRVGESRIGVDFFLEQDDFAIYNIIEEMKKANKKRRVLERTAFNEIDKLVSRKGKQNLIFEMSENWHPGIIGVVASRLALKYNVPVILISTRDGVGKASCRSVGNLNIFNILNKYAAQFTRFGGHDLAAGFVAEVAKLYDIKNSIMYELSNETKKQEIKKIFVDSDLPVENVNDKFIEDMRLLSPFGIGNPQPMFCDYDLEFVNIKKFGVEDRHFKTFIKKDGKLFSAVAFNLGDRVDEKTYPAQRFDIVYYPEKSYYKGEEILQIKIKEFKVKDEFYNIFN